MLLAEDIPSIYALIFFRGWSTNLNDREEFLMSVSYLDIGFKDRLT